MRNHAFAPGEWYHCYNRGVEKRKTFMDPADYRRVTTLLYSGNATVPLNNLTYKTESLADLIQKNKRHGERLVHIGAYCLMPNHFHFLLQERTEGGSVALYAESNDWLHDVLQQTL